MSYHCYKDLNVLEWNTTEFLGVEGATEDKEGVGNLFQLHLFWDCQADGIGCRDNQKGMKEPSRNSKMKGMGVKNCTVT